MAAFNPDEEIFSEDELRSYFRIDLMYGRDGNKWPHETILHLCVKLYPDSTEILERLQRNIPNSELQTQSLKGKLFNTPGEKHAEEILLEHLESAFNPDDISNLSNTSDTSDTFFLTHSLPFNQYDISNLSNMVNNIYLTPSLPSKQDKTNGIIDLKLIMNYSPCNTRPNKCAEKIKTFKEKMGKKYTIRINVIFGSFYRVYNDDRNGHIEGLSNLLNAGIELDLVWDLEHLIKTIEKLEIVTKETRRDRQNADILYMQKVRDIAFKIANDRAAQGEPYVH